MGYKVNSLAIQSLVDNKHYLIPLPDDQEMEKLKKLIKKIKNYQPILPPRINVKK